MHAVPYILFLIGFVFIIKGGDYFVDAATWIAKTTGIPEVIVGATIVSLATTLPETSVSIMAAVSSQPSMAVGNAVGSIICNTGLIIALYNLVRPSKTRSRIFAFKGILMIVYISIFWLMARNGRIDQLSSIVLLIMLVIYFILDVMIAEYKKNQSKRKHFILPAEGKEYVIYFMKFAFGIGLILAGADLLVKYGVILAKEWGIPEIVISLTLIAFGTSLPELVTAISALIKGHTGLSVGNILGANIMNIVLVIGLSAQFGPLTIPLQSYALDIPIAFILSLILIIPSIIYKKISRLQSLLLLTGYCIYIMFLFISN